MTPPATAKAASPPGRRATVDKSSRRQPGSSYNMRDQRRAELDEYYRAGLIAAFTLVPGGTGDRAGWDVERLDGQHVIVATAEVPAFLAGIDAGIVAAGPLFIGKPAPTPDDTVRVPFSEIHDVFGVLLPTIYKWASIGELPESMIEGAVPRDGNMDYSGASVNRRELIDWGRATGRLLPDGTPNRKIHATQAARGARRRDDASAEAAEAQEVRPRPRRRDHAAAEVFAIEAAEAQQARERRRRDESE